MPKVNLTSEEIENILILLEEQELDTQEPWVTLYDKLNNV